MLKISKRSLLITLSLILLIGGLGASIILMNRPDGPYFLTKWTTKNITVDELKQGAIKPIILIDVRSLEEHKQDHIADSQLVPLIDLEAGFGIKKVKSLVEQNTQSNQTKPTVVLYCSSGPRSVQAYKILENTGLNLRVLSGGIEEWRKVNGLTQDRILLKGIIF